MLSLFLGKITYINENSSVLTQTAYIKYLCFIFTVFAVLFHSCSRFDLEDYQLGELAPRSESALQFMADTSQTLPILATFSKKKQVDSLIYYAEWIKNYNEDIALFYAQQAYDMATEKNWNVPRGVSAYRIASLKVWEAKYGEDIEDAMVDAKISRRLLERYENPNWEVYLSNLFGFLFKRDNLLDSARYYFEQALIKVDHLETEKKILDRDKAMILHNLATTYSLKDSIIHVTYYRESDSLYALIDNKKDRAHLWKDQGIFFQYYRQFSKADSLFDLCLDYGLENNDINYIVLAYQEKGLSYGLQFSLFENKNAFSKALWNLKKALNYSHNNDYRTYEIIGNVFQDSWAVDIDESHADSAIYYYKLAMAGAREAGAIRQMNDLSENIATLYNYGGGIHKEALGEKIGSFLNENYTGVVDTITNQAKTAYQRINKIEQRDIQLNAANERKNQLWIILSVFFVAVMIFIYSLQRQQNRRLKAEMEALRAQINPHFISNSLNAIESLVNLGNTKAASKYLVHFSRLTRQILTGSKTSTTTLTGELKTLDHFLALEQLRFRDKLTYQINVDEEIDQEKVQIPAMILQPYVENAIWHGIKPKSEGGHVQVNVDRVGKYLYCAVEDNGIGRDEAKAIKKSSVMQHKSMGMKITEDRIKAMGRIKGSQVEIQDLKDEVGQAKGTRVIIKLPYKTI